MERLMLDVMYKIPHQEDITEVIINRAAVEGRRKPQIKRKSATKNEVSENETGKDETGEDAA